MKTVAIVQARMGSQRLPGKVISLITTKPMIELLLSRLSKSKKIDEIIVAISEESGNDELESIILSLGYQCFRGSEKNVLNRLAYAIKDKKINNIIQLTGDNPFIDPLIIDYIANFFKSNYPKYDFVTNNNLFDITRSVPDGMKVSIFKKNSLLKISKLANKKDHLEHPTLYFYREGKKEFKIKNLKMPKKWHSKLNSRLTLDTKEDFIFLKKIYEKLKNKNDFSLIDILKFIDKNKNYLKINSKITQKIPVDLN